MGTIIMNIEALRAAGARGGIFGDESLAKHLGADLTKPATLAMVAAALTRLPVNAPSLFSMVNVTDDERRPEGGWPIALAGQ